MRQITETRNLGDLAHVVFSMCKALKLLFTYIASHPILETPRVLEEGVQEGISRALTRFREESMGALEGRLDSV